MVAAPICLIVYGAGKEDQVGSSATVKGYFAWSLDFKWVAPNVSVY
jgi:hypothetical protein